METLTPTDARADLLRDLTKTHDAGVDAAKVTVTVEAQDAEPILWHSNAPWVGSGYGTQSALFGARLHRDLGHPLAYSAFFGLRGGKQPWYDPSTELTFPVYPASRDLHGNDILGAHFKAFMKGQKTDKAGWIIFLSDVWVLRAEIAKLLPMLAWCPVDHDPCIPMTLEWFKKGNAIPIAMSEFGRVKLQEGGVKHVQYVPHGFDPAIFKPGDRKAARRALGLPEDTFMVGMVAANLGVPSRKSFSQALTAFSIFQKKHKDSTLYLHSILEDSQGENIPSMCDTLGVRPYCADPYLLTVGLPHAAMPLIHNSFDVLLGPSAGEGFGVPLIEAQACGTPCITTDFSAMPEVAPVSEGNWTVGGQKCWTGFHSWQMTPSIEEIVDALEQAYADSEEERVARRERVYYHAHNNYTADYVTQEHWKPTLDRVREEMVWRAKQMRRFE